MTRLAGTAQKLLGVQTQPRMRQHDIICVHTMVGYLTSTYAMFKEHGFTGTESHVGIGGKWGPDQAADLDGVIWQFQDTDFTADANLEGSWHVLSIETADNAPVRPEQIMPWTGQQVLSLVDVIAAWCVEYAIPPVLIPDTKPGRRGLAYHYQGVGPNLVPGGEKWSAAGHVCPGPARVKQFTEVVIPLVQAKLKPKEEDMQWNDEISLTPTDADIWNASGGVNPKTKKPYKGGDTVTVGAMLRYPTLARKLEGENLALAKEVNDLRDDIGQLKSAVAAIAAAVVVK